MNSGTAAGAVKPKQCMAFEALDFDWLRAGDSHDVQGTTSMPTTGRIHGCSRYPLSLIADRIETLRRERDI